MANNWHEPPVWFKRKDYSRLRDLDAWGWYKELLHCMQIRDDIDLTDWGPPGTYIPAFFGPPVVQAVDKADQSTLRRIEHPTLILQVYLNAPDGKILTEFKKALRLARRKVPAPVSKPGRKTSDAEFGTRHFARWFNRQIVQLCEIDAWRRDLREGNKPADVDIGQWLFPNHADPSKEVATARNALNEAIGLIPALWAQIEGGSTEVNTDN